MIKANHQPKRKLFSQPRICSHRHVQELLRQIPLNLSTTEKISQRNYFQLQLQKNVFCFLKLFPLQPQKYEFLGELIL